jgi:hypothetical protein
MLDKVANVLEKAALYLDAVESEKLAAVKAEREKLLNVMCSKYAEATGEEVSNELKEKLASTDADIISVIEKLAETNSTDDLGGPSERRSASTPMTIKEASASADDQFLSWVLS